MDYLAGMGHALVVSHMVAAIVGAIIGACITGYHFISKEEKE